ncbi:alpha/beta hydrolase [Mesorhizobium sp. M0976]|uniref:alpha/beta hydrolase n=2 Tax=unclassified Mesorhizobium TaxID=325217 RepID=UPI003338C8A2
MRGNATTRRTLLRSLPRGLYRQRNGLKCARFNQLSRSLKIFRFEAGKLTKVTRNQKDVTMAEESLEDGILQENSGFFYRLHRPANLPGDWLFLQHGSGVDETTLLPLGRQIAPHAALVAVRGRIPQEGGFRWFTRITPTRFEQASIRAEADAFAGFVDGIAKRHRFDLSRATFVGYSNGANLVSSVMLLHPGLIERAALLRPMPVLDEVPPADLSKARALIIAGAADLTYAPFAPVLAALLSSHGAKVETQTIASGHEIGDPDAEIVRQWLADPAVAVATSDR